MHLLQPPFKKICQKDNYVLYAHYLSQSAGLKLRVLFRISYIQVKQFDLFIQSLDDYKGIINYCQTLENFVVLIQNPSNISFDFSRKTLSILDKNRFGKIIELQNFEFEDQKTVFNHLSEYLMDNLFSKLQLQCDLTPCEVKEILKCLTQSMLWIFAELRCKSDRESTQEQELDIQNLSLSSNNEFSSISQEDMEQQNDEKQKMRKEIGEITSQIKRIKFQLDKMENKLFCLEQNEGVIIKKSSDEVTEKIHRAQDKLMILSSENERKFQIIFDRLIKSENILQLCDRVLNLKSKHLIDFYQTKDQCIKIEGEEISNRTDNCHIYYKMLCKEGFELRFEFKKINGMVIMGIEQCQFIRQRKLLQKYFLYMSDGSVHINRKFVEKLDGFQVGDIVSLYVNINLGIIQWKVSDTVIKKIQDQSIKNINNNWIVKIYSEKSGTTFTASRII